MPDGNAWQPEYTTYEVLADTDIYAEADSLGDAVFQASRALEDIENEELADVPIYIRRITREIRQAHP